MQNELLEAKSNFPSVWEPRLLTAKLRAERRGRNMSKVGVTQGAGRLPKYTIEDDDERMPRYLSISCHDWACNCSVPAGVQRYRLGSGDATATVGPLLYSRGFVLPKGAYFDKKNKLVMNTVQSDKEAAKNPVLAKAQGGNNGTATKPRPEISVSQIMDLLPLKKSTKQVERQMVENRWRRQFQEVLCRKPVSVKGAFRVSEPHWHSRSHTQRWPWEGSMESRLWSARDQYLLGTSRQPPSLKTAR